MDDDLSCHYDVIVLGTGMPECILAAAVARNGKTVLHLDRNAYYGGEWASFNFDGLQKWIETQKAENEEIGSELENVARFLQDGEDSIVLGKNSSLINDVKEKIFVRERLLEVAEEAIASLNVEETAEVKPKLSEIKEESAKTDDEVTEIAGVCTKENEREVKPKKPKPKEWFLEDFKEQWRKFNLDLAPKVLFSEGSLVNLLISSNISRYADFKCVTRVLTYLNGNLEQVPCSRADVFSTRDVTVVEKRMLMKLLTFCSEYDKHPEEYKDFENKTFAEFLKSRRLTPNVQHYVLHAIAMLSETASTMEGLQATQRFLKSLGRYGNTPFLWPMYGSGELPQCFCRLCAVFGGVYYLKRTVEAILVNAERKITGVVSRNKRINCQWLIVESSYATSLTASTELMETKISRAIFITDKSILKSDKEQITLLRLPATGPLKSIVTVLELCPSSMACPTGLHVVHMTCKQFQNAEEDFKFALEILFDMGHCGDGKSETKKPKILWSVYFSRSEIVPASVQTNCPDGVIITGGPGSDLDFDHAVEEAKSLFSQLFPEEEFLPRAPDPEEIVLDESETNNPGIEEELPDNNGEEEAKNDANNEEELQEAASDMTADEDKLQEGNIEVVVDEKSDDTSSEDKKLRENDRENVDHH